MKRLSSHGRAPARQTVTQALIHWPRRVRRSYLAPTLPAAAQFTVAQADAFIERHGLDQPVGAEMPEALAQLAPSDQHARRLGIAQHDRPHLPLGFLAGQRPVAEPQLPAIADRRSEV